MKTLKLFVLGLAACAVLSVFASCEVGLGEAVDVQAPVIGFSESADTKIESNAVIRDVFALSGEWEDDGSIKEVKVDFVHALTQKKYQIDGEILVNEDKAGSGTWRAVINPFAKDENNPDGLNLLDGSYDFKVTIRDNGGHKTEITRSYVLDNTAPVVALSRPSSDLTSSENEVESYGQIFTIEGQAADDNDIESLIINFYKEDDLTTPVATKVQKSIAATINLDIAKWGDEVYDKLYIGQNYAGTDEAKAEWLKQFVNEKTKKFVCTITAYDGAKCYPVDRARTAEDDLGNKEDSFIRYTDWETLKTSYDEAHGTSIKMPDLYHIKSGTYNLGSGRSASTNNSDSQLWSTLRQKAVANGTFSLNPMNNPTYSISGFTFENENEVENERLLTIQLSKGLDGISLDTSTDATTGNSKMRVFLVPYTDGEIDDSKKLYPVDSTFQKKGDGQFATKITKEKFVDAQGNTAGIDYGKLYIIGVEGADIKGNKILASFDNEVYIMRFKAKEAAPKLSITPTESTLYLKTGDELTISGTTSVPDGHPELTITCAKGDAEPVTVWSYTVKDSDLDTAQSSGSLRIYNFEHTFKAGVGELFDANNSDQYLLEITSALDQYPTTYQKTVIYDVVGPEISLDSIMPVAEKYTGAEDGSKTEGEYLNGNITIKVAITDDDKVYTQAPDLTKNETDRRPYFIITDSNDEELSFRVGTETVASKKHYITTPTKQTFEINTLDILDSDSTDTKPIKIKIYAQDTAGNPGLDINDKTKTEFVREYIVDQTTDKPVILPYNANALTLTYDTKAKIDEALSNKNYKNVLTTGSSLQLRLADDDGVKAYTFKISDKWTSELGENPTLAIPEGYDKVLLDTPTDYMFSYSLPTTSGTYKCSIEIKDVNDKTVKKEFWIIVTGAAPIINDIQTVPSGRIITLATSGLASGAKTKFTNTVSIDSGYETFDVIRREYTSVENYTDTYLYGGTGANALPQLTEKTFTDEFTPSANRYANKVIYIVRDEMGHEGQKEFAYSIDNTAPVVAAAEIVVPSNTDTQKTSYRFKANATDASPAGQVSSNVSVLQYTFDSAKNHIKEVRGVTELDEIIEFKNEDFNYAFGTEGQKTFYVRAIDDVGNVGEWASKTFMYDSSAPEVKIQSYKRESEEEVSFGNSAEEKTLETGKAFALSGSASDTNGIKTLEIWQKKTGTNYEGMSGADKDKGIKLELSASGISNGKWTITGLPRKDNVSQSSQLDITTGGTYLYTVIVTDNSEFTPAGGDKQNAKTVTDTVTVNIDKTAPEVTIELLTDAANHESENYGEKSIKGEAFVFRGTTEDKGAEGEYVSRVSKVYYTFTKTATAPSATAYTKSVTPVGKDWSFSMELGTGTGTDTTSKLYEGKHYLWVKSVDNAGNESAPVYVAFMIDQAAPEITTEVYKYTTSWSNTAETPKEDGSVYITASDATKYKLKVTVSDANGITQFKVNNDVKNLSSDVWEIEVPAQGKVEYEIIAYDGSGTNEINPKWSSAKQLVVFDNVAPQLKDVNLDSAATDKETWFKGEKDTERYISGKITEEGSGLQNIHVKIVHKNGTSYEDTDMALSTNLSYQFKIPENFVENANTDDDYYKVTLSVKDNADNSISKDYYFRYDKTKPTADITVTKPGTYIKDAASIKVEGYAYDSRSATTVRPVKTAQISIKKDGSDFKTIDLKTAANGYNYITSTGTTYGNFSKEALGSTEFGTGNIDGNYELNLIVKDLADNQPENSDTFKVSFTIDATAPIITAPSLKLEDWNSAHSKATIKATFTDTNADMAYYYVYDGSTAAPDITNANWEDNLDWIAMNSSVSGTTCTSTKTHSFNDGEGTVYIKAVDKAGNVSYATSNNLKYAVDTKAPDSCELKIVKVGNSELTGNKLINGSNDVTFVVEAKDYNDKLTYNAATQEATAAGYEAGRIKSVNLVSLKLGNAAAESVSVTGKTSTAAGVVTNTKTGYWVITIPKEKFSGKTAGDLYVTVRVTDESDNYKDFQILTLDIDSVKPTIDDTITVEASYSNSNEPDVYYVNNTRDAMNISGIARDNKELANVTLTLTRSDLAAGATDKTTTYSKTDSAWTFTIAKDTWKDWTGYVDASITATDKAGNAVAAEKTFRINFDSTPPEAVHLLDTAGKDIYFRVGDQKNDDITEASDTPTWNSDLDTDVGGKYSEGTFGNKETIKIRGNFDDAGSGVKMIYYKLFYGNDSPTEGQITAFKDSYSTSADSYFAPLKNTSESKRRVFYTDENDDDLGDKLESLGTVTSATDSTKTKHYAEIESTFSTTISGLKEGKNYLVLVAVDNLNNVVVDSLGDKKYYTINVDNQAPDIKKISDEYTNGTQALTLNFEITDLPEALCAGINTKDEDAVKVTLGSVTKNATLDTSTNKWKVEFATTELPSTEDTYSVTVSAKDKSGSGNSDSRFVGNVIVDKKGPTLNMNELADADDTTDALDVNGIVTISGTASDEVSLAGLVIEYKLSTAETWNTLTQTSDSTKFIWKAQINTTTDTGWKDNDKKTYNLRITATDTAGNTTEKNQDIYVNQDSDRPVITLSQLSNTDEKTLRVKNVYGSIMDDDGSVKKMWYWSKQKAQDNADPTEPPTATANNGWTPITINGGSWSVDSTENDGTTTWYFAVQDNANRIFWNGRGTQASPSPVVLSQPYFKTLGNNSTLTAKHDLYEGITFKYDTTPPAPNTLLLARYPKNTTLTVNEIFTADTNELDTDNIEWSTVNNLAFGCDYNVLYAKIIVTERAGMKALTGNADDVPTSTPVSINKKTFKFKEIKEIHTDGSDTYTYYVGPILMNATGDEAGAYEFKVTVEDVVGNQGFIGRNIIEDNDNPTGVSNVKPNAQGEQNGTFTYRGDANDNKDGSGIVKVEWCIPTTTQSNAGIDNATGLVWTQATLSSQWEIDFSGANNLSDKIHYDTSGDTPTVGADYTGYQTASGSGVYRLPVWFRLTDAVGNIGYDTTNGAIKYNPNADRPSVMIVNPVADVTGTVGGNQIKYVIMGGKTAKISGSADDDEGIGAVYLQFDMNGDGLWDTGVSGLSADLATQPNASTTMITGCPWKGDAIEQIKIVKNGQTISYGYGIKVGETKNWAYTVDLSNSALPSITNGKTLRVRAIAIDNDTAGGQLGSAWSEVLHISVNNSIPLFNNLKLKQIVNNVVKSEIEYDAGKYLTGENWYITADVSTPGGISSASYTNNNVAVDAKSYFTPKSGTIDTAREFTMAIPIALTSEWKIKIDVEDKTNDKNKNSQEIHVRVDNVEPSFADTYASANHSTNGTVKHYVNAYGAKGTELTPSVNVQDTNGLTSLWGKITDTGSGFDKAVFYFKRTDSGGSNNPRVFNPMEKDLCTDLNASKAVGKVYIDTTENTGDNLPALYVKKDTTAGMTVARATENTITVTLENAPNGIIGVNGNKNIRKGGLVKIGGLYRSITEVSGNTVTFTPACDKSFVEAEFIYALVVDNTGETMSGEDIIENDNDGLLENFQTTAGTTTWNASFPSSNIPDGPVELHVVVFDAAGNYNHGYTKTKIGNKPLRITKVMLGTDFNGSGKYDVASEFETFYAVTTSSGDSNVAKGTDIWNLDTKKEMGGASYFTVKNGLAVIPEFVGGNGDVYYAFEKLAAAKTGAKTLTANPNSNKLGTQASINGSVAVQGEDNKIGQLVITNSAIDTTTRENQMSYFAFSFWDSTDGAEAGKDSSWTVLNAQIYQDLVDDKEPNVVVEPFRWAGAGSASQTATNTTEIVRQFTYSTVRGNKAYIGINFYTDEECTTKVNEETLDTATVYTKEAVSINNLYQKLTANGHIELSGDLPAAKFPTTNTTGINDRDPKVSGKISFTGTAYDNVGLSSLWFSIDSFTPTAYYSATDKYGSAGTKTVNVGTAQDPNNKSFYQGAYYDKATSEWKIASATMATNNWELTVEEEYFNQNGHKVRWTLSIDTSKITGVAGTDKTLYMLAVDHNAEDTNATTKVSSLTAAATDSTLTAEGANVPSYRVDVVPYITKVYTSLASLKKKNWSVYNRTALGHYPVRSDETVYMYGFNLGSTSTIPQYNNQALTAPAAGGTQNADYPSGTEYASYQVLTFPVNRVSASGKIEIKVNGVNSLNNDNGPDAKGSYSQTVNLTANPTGDEDIYSNYYNRQPNGDNNNLLTDDLELDVWEFNPQAVVPISGKIEQPVMKIRPTDGKIGFAFVNGPLYFSMGGSETSQDYSYQYWVGSYDFFSSVGFTYDESGNSWGVAAGGDINSTTGDKFFLASSLFGLGTLTAEGSRSGVNIIRMERIAQVNDGILDFDKQRVRSPSLATTIHNGNTNLYLAYYDTMNNQLRFKAGNYGEYANNNESTKTFVRKVEYTDNNNLGVWVKTIDGDTLEVSENDYLYLCDENGNVETGSQRYQIRGMWSDLGLNAFTTYPEGSDTATVIFSDVSGEAYSETGQWTYNFNKLSNDYYVKIIHKQYLKGFGDFVDDKVSSVPTEYEHATVSLITGTDSSGTVANPGQYVSIGAIPGTSATTDTVCAVWYDKTNHVLWYSSNSNPMGHAGETDGTGWSTPLAIFAGKDYENAGEYCKLAVDSYGGVHIAAYDPQNLDLVYAYLPANKNGVAASDDDFATCVVDSNGVVGSNLTLDVGKVSDEGNIIPYIGYYATSSVKPKMAYYKDGFANNTISIPNGSENDSFTGMWECITIPTNQTIEMQSLQHNDINIGLWKENGVIVDSTSSKYTTGTSSTSNSFDSYDSVSYGQVYGNGTRNAVLGYTITWGDNSDRIETAQMK